MCRSTATRAWGGAGTDGSSMAVIDLAARKVVSTVDFGHGVRPHMPLVEPVSGMLYVTTELDKAVTMIDPKTLKIVGKSRPGRSSRTCWWYPRRQARLYGECRAGDGVGAGHRGAKDGGRDSDLRHDAANLHLTGRQDGVYGGPDEAADGGDRYGDEYSEELDPLPAVGYGSTVTPDGRWLLVEWDL